MRTEYEVGYRLKAMYAKLKRLQLGRDTDANKVAVALIKAEIYELEWVLGVIENEPA